MRDDLDQSIARAVEAIENDPNLNSTQRAAAIAEVERIQTHHILPRALVDRGVVPGTATEEAREILGNINERIQELDATGEFGSRRPTRGQLADDPSNLVPLPTSPGQIQRLRENGLPDWPDGQIHNGSHSGAYHDRLAEILEESLERNGAIDSRNFSAEELRLALADAFEAIVSPATEADILRPASNG